MAGTWGEEGEDSQREREKPGPRGLGVLQGRQRKDVWSSLRQPHLPMGPIGELHAGGARMRSPVASEDHVTPATSPGTTKEAMMPSKPLEHLDSPGVPVSETPPGVPGSEEAQLRTQAWGRGYPGVVREGMGSLAVPSPRTWPRATWISCFPSLEPSFPVPR